MTDVGARLVEIVGAQHVLEGDAIGDDYTHDEALGLTPHRPAFVVRPSSTEDVAAVVNLAGESGLPVTARGSGTGLSGACVPAENGILVSFERMNHIVEIDTDNHTAGSRDRRGDQHRRQAGQVEQRVRPHAADHRIGRDAGRRHQGDVETPSPSCPRGDAAGAVLHA